MWWVWAIGIYLAIGVVLSIGATILGGGKFRPLQFIIGTVGWLAFVVAVLIDGDSWQ